MNIQYVYLYHEYNTHNVVIKKAAHLSFMKCVNNLDEDLLHFPHPITHLGRPSTHPHVARRDQCWRIGRQAAQQCGCGSVSVERGSHKWPIKSHSVD